MKNFLCRKNLIKLLLIIIGISTLSVFVVKTNQRSNKKIETKTESTNKPSVKEKVSKKENPLLKDAKPIAEVKEVSKSTPSKRITFRKTNTRTPSVNQKVERYVYKYCPTVINGTVLYCSNEATPGEIKDGISLNGRRVLTTTPGAWDSVQVCDPSVISGNFSFQGSNYSYLMAYLGCRTYDCTNNEIGFAVSNDLYNWTKVGRVVGTEGGWGVGQPSLLTKNGKTFLFYTRGTTSLTSTLCRELISNDLTSVNLSQPVTVRNMGGDFISNADFAVSGDELYMTCDTHVNYMFPAGALSNISQTQSIYVTSWNGDLGDLQGVGWNRVAAIGPGNTGHNRNHNGCFIRDGAGNLAERAILVSTADEVGDFKANLWTYRFQKVNF